MSLNASIDNFTEYCVCVCVLKKNENSGRHEGRRHTGSRRPAGAHQRDELLHVQPHC